MATAGTAKTSGAAIGPASRCSNGRGGLRTGPGLLVLPRPGRGDAASVATSQRSGDPHGEGWMVITPRGVTREVRGTPEIPPLAKAHPPSGPDTTLDIDDIPFVESQTSHESGPLPADAPSRTRKPAKHHPRTTPTGRRPPGTWPVSPSGTDPRQRKSARRRSPRRRHRPTKNSDLRPGTSRHRLGRPTAASQANHSAAQGFPHLAWRQHQRGPQRSRPTGRGRRVRCHPATQVAGWR